MQTVQIVDVLEVSCFKFQLSVTSGTPSKTPLSTISWLDPWKTWWFLMHTVWIVDVLEVSCFKFQLSVTSGTPSKTPLSTVSWLDPWRTLWFLMHSVCIVDGNEVSCFKFQLPALCDIRNIIKDTPIHHLLVGSLVDMVVPDAYCMDIWCPWHKLTPQM